MSAFTDFSENKLIDWFLRGQALNINNSTAGAGSGPSIVYVGLLTSTTADAGGGTEVSGNGYARVAVTSSLANWAGTQGAGTTTASTGTNGTTSNNIPINFPVPTPAGWGTITGAAIYDLATGGNAILSGDFAASKTINANDAAVFVAGSLQFQWDN
jgi:hypothetical protein